MEVWPFPVGFGVGCCDRTERTTARERFCVIKFQRDMFEKYVHTMPFFACAPQPKRHLPSTMLCCQVASLAYYYCRRSGCSTRST